MKLKNLLGKAVVVGVVAAATMIVGAVSTFAATVTFTEGSNSLTAVKDDLSAYRDYYVPESVTTGDSNPVDVTSENEKYTIAVKRSGDSNGNGCNNSSVSIGGQTVSKWPKFAGGGDNCIKGLKKGDVVIIDMYNTQTSNASTFKVNEGSSAKDVTDTNLTQELSFTTPYQVRVVMESDNDLYFWATKQFGLSAIGIISDTVEKTSADSDKPAVISKGNGDYYAVAVVSESKAGETSTLSQKINSADFSKKVETNQVYKGVKTNVNGITYTASDLVDGLGSGNYYVFASKLTNTEGTEANVISKIQESVTNVFE
jgi:hypothetical protein